MATERVTIQIESNIGEDGPLTVNDTLHQFMDAFELLSAAISEEVGGDKIQWRLETLSKNSPATAVAVAYSLDQDIIVAPLVHRGKKRFSDGIISLSEGNVVPWLAKKSSTAKDLFRRNLNGVGRTIIDLEEDAPRTVIVEKSARANLRSLELLESTPDVVDRSRSVFGTIDANVTEAKTYYGRPAIYVKERLSGKIVPCTLSDKAAATVGLSHSWADTWAGKRVRVKGQLFYDRNGALNRINAVDLVNVNPSKVDLEELRKMNVLGDTSPAEHVDRFWGFGNE